MKNTLALPRHVAQDRVVQRLREAEVALSRAAGIDQIKLVMDAAAAQEVFAERQQLGEDVIGYAHSIKSRALAKLGEFLQQMPKAEGTRGQGRPSLGGTRSAPPKSSSATYAELGLDKKTAAVAQQLASLDSATREAIAQRETTFAQVRRELKAAEVRKAVQLPDAKYRVIYADPPWRYADKADAGAVQAGGGVPPLPLDVDPGVVRVADP